MRQNKKLTWLQACFLGDVRVIWCIFLGDSLFQTYVINFVEIMIDYYLHITSHVSLAITSCTHYTSYFFSKLSTWCCVWIFFGHPRWYVLWIWCKICLMFEFWRQISWKTCFWKIWVEFMCFWKTFNLILMHFFHEILWFEEFLHKIALFFKNPIFPDFQSIEYVA